MRGVFNIGPARTSIDLVCSHRADGLLCGAHHALRIWRLHVLRFTTSAGSSASAVVAASRKRLRHGHVGALVRTL